MDPTAQEQDPASDPLERVAEIARRLAEAEDLDELLQRIVDLGQSYLQECDGVSLMMIRKGGEISSPAYSSRVAYESDLAQYETDEGPCLEAIRAHETIVIDDLLEDERWPDYGRRASELGVRSMISFRLFVLGDTMGALDFYSARPNAFDVHDRSIGQVFASHAAVAMKAAVAESSLEAALATRDLIGQAKGVLMAQEAITADAAFRRLQEISQRENRPLRSVAKEITETGEAPADG